MTDRLVVWFHRPLLPDLAAEVEAVVEATGPWSATAEHGLANARGVVAGAGRFDAAFMASAPSLEVIGRTGIGVDGVDVAEATRRGIAVCNAPDAPTVSTAEHAVALMLAVAKRLADGEARLRAGESGLYASHEAIELDGKMLGLVGLGRIARHVARVAGGLGMEVTAFDPFLGEDEFGHVRRASSLMELLATADVVSVHVPGAPGTPPMFGPAEFAAMKPGAVFVNTARGGLVDHEALLHALDRGSLFGAGLDVTDPEPLPADHPLLHRRDVAVTPHVATATAEAKRRLFRTALSQVLMVFERTRPPHLVNPDVWPRLAANEARGARG